MSQPEEQVSGTAGHSGSAPKGLAKKGLSITPEIGQSLKNAFLVYIDAGIQRNTKLLSRIEQADPAENLKYLDNLRDQVKRNLDNFNSIQNKVNGFDDNQVEDNKEDIQDNLFEIDESESQTGLRWNEAAKMAKAVGSTLFNTLLLPGALVEFQKDKAKNQIGLAVLAACMLVAGPAAGAIGIAIGVTVGVALLANWINSGKKAMENNAGPAYQAPKSDNPDKGPVLEAPKSDDALAETALNATDDASTGVSLHQLPNPEQPPSPGGSLLEQPPDPDQAVEPSNNRSPS